MNALLPEGPVVSKPSSALKRLETYVEELHRRKKPIESMEAFEREVHALVVQVEQEIVADGLSQFDIEARVVEVDGQLYRQVYRGEKSYLSAAGEIRVERSLYRAHGGKAICPLELQAGIIDGYWTPLAARQGVWVTAQLPPAEGEALFEELGNMTPSKSSLDRLSRELGEQWEAHREGFEATLCEEIRIPEEAVSMSASLDGVMVPMKRPPAEASSEAVAQDESPAKTPSDGQAEAGEAAAPVNEASERKRPPAEASSEAVAQDESPTKTPSDGQAEAGEAAAPANEASEKKPCYKEASCATVSFYDAAGKRLDTIRFARMPEGGKKILKAQLAAAVATILGQRPELELVKLADGAEDNWRFLTDELRPGKGVELLDFFHASEHLSEALEAAYGKGSHQAKAQHKKYRTILREEEQGVEKVIRALAYLKKKHPRREKLAKQLNYFRNNRHRMSYATARANHLPIGSGVTEAACKTLVTQRLKCSGMRWKTQGGQGVLTVRGLIQSHRFDRGWQLLSHTYRQTVSMPKNVVLLHDKNR